MQGTRLIAGISHPEAFGCCRGQGWRPEEVRRGEMSWREVLGRALGSLDPWEGLFGRRARGDRDPDPISGGAPRSSQGVPVPPPGTPCPPPAGVVPGTPSSYSK